MAWVDRVKRSFGTARRRRKPSKAAQLLVSRGLVVGRVLDFGCGYGLDADHFGWEAYDPCYRPVEPRGQYDTVLCTLVLSTLSRRNRAQTLERIRDLLTAEGVAYLTVSRNIPLTGKLVGPRRFLQNYVVLTLPSVHADGKIEIYALKKNDEFDDRTKDYVRGGRKTHRRG